MADPSCPGGWSAIKVFRKAGIRLKGDEWILGDSEFVEQVLDTANESLGTGTLKGMILTGLLSMLRSYWEWKRKIY